MVNRTPSKRFMSIRIRLAAKYIRVSHLIGKGLSCHESRCRFESDLARFGIFVIKIIISNNNNNNLE